MHPPDASSSSCDKGVPAARLICFAIPVEDADFFRNALEEAGHSVFTRLPEPGQTDIEIQLVEPAENPVADWPERIAALASLAGLAKAPEVHISSLAATDWRNRLEEDFPPLTLPPFYIYGAHVTAPPPAGLHPLQIDAGMAFGSGEHGTTAGCLAALAGLAKRRRIANALDMGCGSGILAMGIARCWPAANIIAADCDPRAVRVTRDNLHRNQLSKQICAIESDGCRAPLITRHAPYDLLCANILARPLIDMATDFTRLLAPDGDLILSGLLARQQAAVLAAYRTHGFFLHRALLHEGWATLHLRQES